MLYEKEGAQSSLSPLISEWALVVDNPDVELGTSLAVVVRSPQPSEVLRWLDVARKFSMRLIHRFFKVNGPTLASECCNLRAAHRTGRSISRFRLIVFLSQTDGSF